MENKRGLSDVISTVLIVLLALAAIAIVWGFIQPLFDDAGTSIDWRTRCLDAEVKPTSCIAQNSTSNGSIIVQYLKGDVSVAAVSLEHADGTTTVRNVNLTTLLSSVKIDNQTIGAINVGETVRVAPVIVDDEGTSRPCDFSPVEVTCIA